MSTALASVGLVCSSFGYAQASSGPTALNVSGALYSSSGSAISNSNVTFKIEILDKAATCVLYSEVHAGQDLSTSKGAFSLVIGSGTSVQNYISSSTSLDSKVFENPGTVAAFTGCPSGVTLASGDERLIRVSYDLTGGTTYTAMSPDVPIVSSAYAMVAQTLQGLAPSDLIQMKSDASNELTQANAEYIFNTTNYPKLKALVDGNSSQYMVSNPSSAVSFNGQVLNNVGTPTASTDAANKSYVDSNLGGYSADYFGVGPSTGDGSVMIWNASANKWVAGIPTTVDNTKLPLAGGTMQGPISMSGYDFLGTGHITVSPGKTLTFGTLDDSAETTLVGTLTAANAGATWYNTSHNVLKIWDGSHAFTQAYLDATTSKIDASWIPDTTVTTGSYGSATKVPTFTVGSDGRLTAAAEVSISGVAPGGTAGGDLTGNYPNPTITTDAVTTAKIHDNAITPAKLQSTGVATNQMLITDASTGTSFNYATCLTQNEIMAWDGSGWACTDVSTIAPVTKVAGKTGNVTLNAADISGLGTAATKDYGTASGNLVQLDGSGKVPTALLPTGTGTVTSIASGAGLTGGPITSSGTLAVNVGIAANQILQLNASARIPAVDGSLLTNINAIKLQSRTVASTAPSGGQVLTWNSSTSQWEPKAVSAGTGDFMKDGSVAMTGNLKLNGHYLSGDGGSEGVYVDSSGNVGIGTSTPAALLDMAGSGDQGFQMTTASSTAGDDAFINLRRSRGTLSAPSVVSNGDSLAWIEGDGYNGSAYSQAASIEVAVDGTPASNVPGRIVFSTNDSGANHERMRITSLGNVGIGTTSPGAKLDVNGGIHPGSATIEASCSGVLEGTLAYDPSAHMPVYCNSSGLWAAVSANFRTSCPSGFTLIGTSGTAEAFCISSNQETSDTWLNAMTACYNRSPNAHLCSANEWGMACVAGTGGPNNMTGHSEWVSDLARMGGAPYAAAVTMGASACDSIGFSSLSSSFSYRCCFR